MTPSSLRSSAGIGFTLADNAFLRIDDWESAQTLANRLSPDLLHRVLYRYAQQCCLVLDVFAQSYHSLAKRLFVRRVEIVGEIDKQGDENEQLETVRSETTA